MKHSKITKSVVSAGNVTALNCVSQPGHRPSLRVRLSSEKRGDGRRLSRNRQPIAVAYVRNETNQEQSQLYDQKSVIRAYAMHRKLRIAEIFEDVGATDDHRPGLTELLKAARGRKFRVLIVAKQSRLARGLTEMKAVLEPLEACGVRVYEACGRPITLKGKGGKLTLMLAILDELELLTIRKCIQARVGNVQRGFGARRGSAAASDRFTRSADRKRRHPKAARSTK